MRSRKTPWSPIFRRDLKYGAVTVGSTPQGFRPPTVTIEQGATQTDAQYGGGSVVFDVEFSEAVTGFATGDITLTGTAGATTGTVSGSGASYAVTVTGMTTCGTVIADIAAGVATSVAHGGANEASTSADNEVIYLPDFADNFNRADGGLGGNWSSSSGVAVVSNKVYANGSGRFAVWGTDVCGSYDQFAQMDVDLLSYPSIGAAPAVRMDAATTSYYSGSPQTGNVGPAGWSIGKRVGGSGTTLAFLPDPSVVEATYTVRLAAIDCGSLGTMLCLYEMVAGVPVFKIAGFDPAASQLASNKIGMNCGIDTATWPGGHSVGDNWMGGDFLADDGIHDMPRGFGGWATFDGTTWNHEFQVGTENFGVRGGGSLDVAWLDVAGGGGGGAVIGGGAGGGGVRYGNTTITTAVPVATGAAGTRGWVGVSTATNGGDSSIGTAGAIASTTGGGRGYGADGGGHGPSNGGSGGGGGAFGVTTGGTGVSGEGFAGGGNSTSSYGAAGGGGASAVGANSTGGPGGGNAGAGGAGKQWPTSSGGDGNYYGGGGGGGCYTTSGGQPQAAGGVGGGGPGGTRHSGDASYDGTPKTGGGGGGAGHNDAGGTGSPVGGFGSVGVNKFRYTDGDWTP